MSGRRISQILSALLINPYFPAIASRGIYQGRLKYFCVPVLNCYSCPLAVFSCPLGALQNFFASLRGNLSAGVYQLGLYVLGWLGLVGAIGGRVVCGWICPFGLLQEGLYKLKTPKIALPRRLRYLKYALLALTIFLLPALLLDQFGYGKLWFCAWICPAGTLEAGLPLVGLNPQFRSMIGFQFWFKLSLLVGFLALMILSRRPFCRIACPLGAFLSLFNKLSLLRLEVDLGRCQKCDACLRSCPVELRVYEEPNDMECIRCLRCRDVCPVEAVRLSLSIRRSSPKPDVGAAR